MAVEIERTLVLVKPDGVKRRLVGAILGRFEERGLRVCAMRLLVLSEAQAAAHYAPHAGRPFYPGLIRFITSGASVAAVLEGPRAIALVRAMMGATDPLNAAPGTIRGDLAVDMGMNLVHGSDSAQSAAREIANLFAAAEIASAPLPDEGWLFGDD